MSTFVICPVLNEWALTRRMLLSLNHAEVDRVLILDNGSTDITATAIRSWQHTNYQGIGRKLTRTAKPGASIYEMWNHGFDWARRESGIDQRNRWNPVHSFYVLVTNNDIELSPFAIPALRKPLQEQNDAWATYPDYDAPWGIYSKDHAWSETSGVLSSGGLFGACFMLAGHRIPWRSLITDASYEHWYGDDHLAECIEQEGGKQLRVLGLPVQHVNEATARHYPELYNVKLRDRGMWITREQRGTRAITRQAGAP